MASRVTKEEGNVLLAEFMYIGLLSLGLSVLEFTCKLFFIQLAIIFSNINSRLTWVVACMLSHRLARTLARTLACTGLCWTMPSRWTRWLQGTWRCPSLESETPMTSKCSQSLHPSSRPPVVSSYRQLQDRLLFMAELYNLEVQELDLPINCWEQVTNSSKQTYIW